MGVVPKFDAEEDSVYDIRDFPPAAAEVAVLTLLRVFRRHSDSHAHAGMDSPPMPNVVLRVWSDEEHEAGPQVNPIVSPDPVNPPPRFWAISDESDRFLGHFAHTTRYILGLGLLLSLGFMSWVILPI